MTMHFLPIGNATEPSSGVWSRISRSSAQYIEAQRQRKRLAHLNKVLSELDPHILKDIGMEGFERLTPAQRSQVLLKRGPAGLSKSK